MSNILCFGHRLRRGNTELKKKYKLLIEKETNMNTPASIKVNIIILII